MLIDHGDRVVDDLLGRVMAVSVLLKLHQMKLKLVEQAFAQIAAGYAGRIELPDRLQGFVQIGAGKSRSRNLGLTCRQRAGWRRALLPVGGGVELRCGNGLRLRFQCR